MEKKKIWILCITIASILLAGCTITKNHRETISAEEKNLITVGFAQIGAESDWRIANTESMKEALSVENGFRLPMHSKSSRTRPKQSGILFHRR